MNVFVFDIETIPDIEGGRRVHDLGDLPDDDVLAAMEALRRQETGNDFQRLPLHRIVAISVVFRTANTLKAWSLGDEQSGEKELIERFFAGIEKYTPTLVSWNGGGFDLPVLHYRAMRHGITAARYWDQGENDREFKWNNYLSRYHTRHIDLMDVLAQFQPRANAPLDAMAKLCGFPGKLGMDGSAVAAAIAAGGIDDVRSYCETDVLNTFLVYQRFRLMRGELTAGEYAAEISLAREKIAATGAAHWKAFLAAWDANAKA